VIGSVAAWTVQVARQKQAANESLCAILRDIFGFRPLTIAASWPTPELVALATTIYEQRAFSRLPELGAGCTDSELRRHLCGPGPHVRGCWVVDLLLNKE
jgi:hypothetical protein